VELFGPTLSPFSLKVKPKFNNILVIEIGAYNKHRSHHVEIQALKI
jgi:hypothetical protein